MKKKFQLTNNKNSEQLIGTTWLLEVNTHLVSGIRIQVNQQLNKADKICDSFFHLQLGTQPYTQQQQNSQKGNNLIE